jgi:hypothetical protein
MSVTVRALRRRAERAGAVAAAEFADWLILDLEWFGPAHEMDRATYDAWRGRALRIYGSDPGLSVDEGRSSGRPRPPKVQPSMADKEARFVVRAFLVTVAAFAVVAMLAATSALSPVQGPDLHGSPTVRSSRAGCQVSSTAPTFGPIALLTLPHCGGSG